MTDATRTVLVAGLAVLAVAVAAATLDATAIPDRSGPVGVEGSGGTGGVTPAAGSGPTPGEALQVPLLTALLAVLAAVALLATVAAVLRYRGTALRVLGLAVVLVAVGWVLLALLSWFVGPAQPWSATTAPLPGGALDDGGAGGGGRPDAVQPTPLSLVLLFVLGVALVSAVLALVRATGDGGSDAADEATADDGAGATAAAVGRAAGRAAERLETDRAADNEVYRAWREMTALLDVEDAGSSTPGEFAVAAVDAGLGREDVDELTRLFEDVRYGGTRPSDDHERRAVAVFRRIEDRYAGDDA